MATLSINQAAKTFKKGRSTIQAMLKAGELSRSADGEGIEFSELLRVFGEPTSQPTKPTQETKESRASTTNATPSHDLRQPAKSTQDMAQSIELAVLKERVTGLENLLAEREKLVLLLTHKTTEATPKPTEKPIKRTIWQKLFYD